MKRVYLTLAKMLVGKISIQVNSVFPISERSKRLKFEEDLSLYLLNSKMDDLDLFVQFKEDGYEFHEKYDDTMKNLVHFKNVIVDNKLHKTEVSYLSWK